MTLPFDFLSPQKICFGWGRRNELGELASQLGTKAFLIQGSRHLKSSGELKSLSDSLASKNIECVELGEIHREPRVEDVDQLVESIRPQLTDQSFVIGIGGGAAIDLAKAVSAVATNQQFQSVADGLEGVGKGYSIETPPVPFLAMPTTSGTGSEATKNSVISSNPEIQPPYKKSLRSNLMMPDLVLIDPELTCSVPAEVTARCGMDAVTQLIESILSKRATSLTTHLAWHGLELALPAISKAVHEPNNRQAREAMSKAAYLSGLCLANSGLGLAHGVAPPLGMHCDVPHGLACALMLPSALDVNRFVREAEVAKFIKLFDKSLENLSDAEASELASDKIRELLTELKIPTRLSEVGVQRDQIPDIVKGSRGNSMSGNPREVTDEELTQIMESLF